MSNTGQESTQNQNKQQQPKTAAESESNPHNPNLRPVIYKAVNELIDRRGIKRPHEPKKAE